MPEIIVYSTPTCTHCKLLKKFFQDRQITYREYDLSTDEQARENLADKLGRLTVPVTLIDDEIIVGFDQIKLEELLKQRTG